VVFEPGRGQRRDAHRQRVCLVGLAAVSSTQHPYPAAKFRWYVKYLDTIGGQPRAQRCTQSGGALDRPGRLRPASREPSQFPVAVPVDLDPRCAQGPQLAVHGDCGPGRFVRVDGDDDAIVGSGAGQQEDLLE
jgi:hypothetical protein